MGDVPYYLGGAAIVVAISCFWRYRAKLEAKDVFQGIGVILTAAAMLATTFNANADRKQNEEQFAELRGAANYTATHSPDWTLRLMPIQKEGYLPGPVRLVPAFLQEDGTYLDGDKVPIAASAPKTDQQGHRFIEIPNADKLACQGQTREDFDCDKTPLSLLWIEFDRLEGPVTVPIYSE